jgi:hypothetical protein
MRDKIDAVRKDLDLALKEIGTKHGISLVSGNASYTNTNFTMKIKASVIVGGVVQSPERVDFKMYAKMIGLEPADLGKVFRCDGSLYEIVGYKKRCTKRPIVCKKEKDGKRYKFSAEMIKYLIKT